MTLAEAFSQEVGAMPLSSPGPPCIAHFFLPGGGESVRRATARVGSKVRRLRVRAPGVEAAARVGAMPAFL